MKIVLKTTLLALVLTTVTSCMEKPKQKAETVQTAVEYEKVIDDIVGVGTIVPTAIKAGDKDTMVESLTIANNFTRERFRRELTVKSVEKDGVQTKYEFEVRVIERNTEGVVQPPYTVLRTLVLILTPEGYYQFVGNQTDFTEFSWDTLIQLRGFCSGFEDDNYKVTKTCSSLQVEAATFGDQKIPVRKISLNRSFEIVDKKTGVVDSGKLRFVIQIAPQIQEISKVVSFCVEGLQKFDNAAYQLVNCKNIESL